MTTLYLTEPGTVVRLQNQSLLIQRQGRQQHQRLAELTLVVVLPGVQYSVFECPLAEGMLSAPRPAPVTPYPRVDSAIGSSPLLNSGP